MKFSELRHAPKQSGTHAIKFNYRIDIIGQFDLAGDMFEGRYGSAKKMHKSQQ